MEGRKSYDFGVTPIDVIEKPIGNGAQQEIKRRADIREERYFIRIYINGYEVVKS